MAENTSLYLSRISINIKQCLLASQSKIPNQAKAQEVDLMDLESSLLGLKNRPAHSRNEELNSKQPQSDCINQLPPLHTLPANTIDLIRAQVLVLK